jgi:hypothetical protein
LAITTTEEGSHQNLTLLPPQSQASSYTKMDEEYISVYKSFTPRYFVLTWTE